MSVRYYCWQCREDVEYNPAMGEADPHIHQEAPPTQIGVSAALVPGLVLALLWWLL